MKRINRIIIIIFDQNYCLTIKDSELIIELIYQQPNQPISKKPHIFGHTFRDYFHMEYASIWKMRLDLLPGQIDRRYAFRC